MFHLLHVRRLLLFPSTTLHHQHRRTTYRRVRDLALKGGEGSHGSFASLLVEAKRDAMPISVRLVGQSMEPAAILDGQSLQAETPRTSNVVARLMGLDVLPTPDATPRRFPPSPAPSTSSPCKPRPRDHKENDGGKNRRGKKPGCGRDHPSPPTLAPPRRKPLSTRNGNILVELEASRSFPGTPRVSSSGRWSCDGDTPRLSLQLNTITKNEFDDLCEVVPESKLVSASREEKNLRRRPQILHEEKRATDRAGASGTVKQHSKEGADIRTGDATLVGLRRVGHEKKKIRGRNGADRNHSLSSELTGENTPETKLEVAGTVIPNIVAPLLTPSPSLSSPFLEYRLDEGNKKPRVAKPCSDRFTEKLKKPPSAKAAVRGGASRRTSSVQRPLCSSSRRKVSSTSLNDLTLRPPMQRKRQLPSPPPSPLPSPPQTLLHPSTVVPTLDLVEVLPPSVLHGCIGSRSTQDDEVSPEYRYVRNILQCVGLLSKATRGRPATLARWHSPSHPVDPTIFHRLELFLPDDEDGLHQLGRLRHRCNRRLLFHLVEEMLAHLLRPCLGAKPWLSSQRHTGETAAVVVMKKRDGGEALLRHLWLCIRGFRPTEVGDMQDLDALVGSDMAEEGARLLKEEVESTAVAVEGAIFDTLVEEAARSIILCSAAAAARRRGREGHWGALQTPVTST